jgi:hypothetical protein
VQKLLLWEWRIILPVKWACCLKFFILKWEWEEEGEEEEEEGEEEEEEGGAGGGEEVNRTHDLRVRPTYSLRFVSVNFISLRTLRTDFCIA